MSLVSENTGGESAEVRPEQVAELRSLVATAEGGNRKGSSRRLARVVARARLLFASDALVRGSLGLMGTTVLTSVLGYIYWIAAARGYATADVGIAGALISAVTIVSILGNFGLGSALIQRLPRSEGATWSATLNAGLLAGAIAGTVVGAVGAILLPRTAHTFTSLSSAPVALLFVAACATWTAAAVLDCVFIAERASSRLLVRNTFGSVAKIPLLFVPLIAGWRSERSLFASWTIAAVLSLLLGVLVLVPRVKPGYRLRLRGTMTQFRAMRGILAGHHLSTIGSILPTWLLPVVVAIRLSPDESAYFFITWMVCGVFFMVSPAVSSAVFAEGAHDARMVYVAARRSARLIATLLVVPMLVFVVFGHLILRVFGPAYPAAGYGLLVVLVVSAIPDAITNVAVAVYRVEGKLRRAAALNLAMSVVTLAMAWVLLPSIGIVVAGIAWLVAQSAGSLFVFAMLRVDRRRATSPEVVL